MYGAILGDMIGAPYEFDRSKQNKDFDMFNKYIRYTDDSMMTIAIADAIMTAGTDADEQTMKTQFVRSMQKWGREYPDAGYGGMFYQWLYESEPEPYGSFGNGSAMRVSSVGWFFDTLEKTREVARWSAEVTHNHPEGIKSREQKQLQRLYSWQGRVRARMRSEIISLLNLDTICLRTVIRSVRGISLT